MSWHELKVWEPMCSRCHRTGPVVFSQYTPRLPADWTEERVHNCGMTGYSRTDIYCGDCSVERAKVKARFDEQR